MKVLILVMGWHKPVEGFLFPPVLFIVLYTPEAFGSELLFYTRTSTVASAFLSHFHKLCSSLALLFTSSSISSSKFGHLLMFAAVSDWISEAMKIT